MEEKNVEEKEKLVKISLNFSSNLKSMVREARKKDAEKSFGLIHHSLPMFQQTLGGGHF